MSLPLVLRPEAEGDLRAACDWYVGQRVGLGDTFLDVVEEMFERIRFMPEAYAALFGNVRRCKLRRFPYVVYYRVLADRIEVISILHGSRDPRIWQDRI